MSHGAESHEPLEVPLEVPRYASCRLGDMQCVVDAAMVHAVLVANYGVVGEVPFHGQRFPVADPRPLFHLPAGRGECQALLLADRQPVVALLVDSVGDDLDIHPHRFQPLPWHFAGRERLWISGVMVAADGDLVVRLHPAGLRVSVEGLDADDSEARHG